MTATLVLRTSFTRQEWCEMIEDPKLTRGILEFFASDSIGFPANVMVQRELAEAYPHHDLSILKYHVICAFNNDLLMGSVDRQEMIDGVLVNIGYIDGLTAKGGDYVRDSKTEFWGKAWEKIADAGLSVTTDRLLEMITLLSSKALVGE